MGQVPSTGGPNSDAVRSAEPGSRESWTWVDSRTRKRVSITTVVSREQAEKQLAYWHERDAKGGRPDLREALPYIVVTRVPDSHWGSDPGDVIPEFDGRTPSSEERHCRHLRTHEPHLWCYADRERAARAAGLKPRPIPPQDEVVYACPGNPHRPHEQACCPEHGTHSMPHVGCLLR